MAGTRDDFDDFWGNDEEDAAPPVADTKADGRLLHVPLARISPNTVNPRTEFGTTAELKEFGLSLQRRQQQPILVVSKSAYLKLWDHGDQIGDVDFVIVCGERRYRAAQAVGMTGLDVVVNDDTAASTKTFLDAVVSENVDRRNFDPIEEAYAVAALVAAFGKNRDVAKHFGRTDAWVTQRVCLTYLAPAVQQQVRDKEVALELARSLGPKAKKGQWDEGQQKRWLAEERERLEREREAKKADRVPSKAPTGRQSSRETTDDDTSGQSSKAATGEEAAESFTAVNSAPSKPAATAEPKQPSADAARGSGTETAPGSGEAVQDPVVEPVADGTPEPGDRAAQPQSDKTPQCAVVNAAAPAAAEGVPGQREEQSDDAPKGHPAWNQPGTLNGLIRARTENPNFYALFELLLEQGLERDEKELRRILEAFAEKV